MVRVGKAQTDRGGGIAGEGTNPINPAALAAVGGSTANGGGSAPTIATPGMAAQGVAHAAGGTCLAGGRVGLLAQFIIGDATGMAAIAAVSQSGTSRTSSITASAASTKPRTIREVRRRRAIILSF